MGGPPRSFETRPLGASPLGNSGAGVLQLPQTSHAPASRQGGHGGKVVPQTDGSRRAPPGFPSRNSQPQPAPGVHAPAKEHPHPPAPFTAPAPTSAPVTAAPGQQPRFGQRETPPGFSTSALQRQASNSTRQPESQSQQLQERQYSHQQHQQKLLQRPQSGRSPDGGAGSALLTALQRGSSSTSSGASAPFHPQPAATAVPVDTLPESQRSRQQASNSRQQAGKQHTVPQRQGGPSRPYVLEVRSAPPPHSCSLFTSFAP